MKRRAMKLFALAVLGASWAILGTATAGAASCPNEAFRLGPSALLPECRAYEMVSPADKGGASVNQLIPLHVAPDGDGIDYFANGAFAGNPSSPTIAAYASHRGADNWQTAGLDAPQVNTSGFIQEASPVSSPDLSKTLQYSRVALTPGAVEGGSNVYIQNNLTGERELVTGHTGAALFQATAGGGGGSLFLDGTSDWSHILLKSKFALNSEVTDGSEHLYDFTGGRAVIVDRLPNGEISPAAHAGVEVIPYGHQMSDNGSRIYFVVSPFGTGQIYLRENGETTIPVSVSHRAGEEGIVKPANFYLASADGRFAFFTSSEGLTEDNTASALYRFDADTGELIDLTPTADVNGARVGRVLVASEDGSYVYFVAGTSLTPDTPATAGPKVYGWHDGTLKYVATVDPTERLGPNQSLTSPDGSYLAFDSSALLTSTALPSSACPASSVYGNPAERCQQVYLFDYTTDQLTCVSCDGIPRGHSMLGGWQTGALQSAYGDEVARSVLNDGAVFFNTPNRLLPRDVNGQVDTYTWREGVEELISSGTAEGESIFAGASADGRNVFFLTGQSLVPQDIDGSVDVYDARMEGGLAGQWPPGAQPPCEAEDCRASIPTPAVGRTAATPYAVAGGNAVAASRAAACKKQKSRAAKARKRTRQLTRQARHATGRRAHKLRVRAAKSRRQTKQLNQKARNCGGQG